MSVVREFCVPLRRSIKIAVVLVGFGVGGAWAIGPLGDDRAITTTTCPDCTCDWEFNAEFGVYVVTRPCSKWDATTSPMFPLWNTTDCGNCLCPIPGSGLPTGCVNSSTANGFSQAGGTTAYEFRLGIELPEPSAEAFVSGTDRKRRVRLNFTDAKLSHSFIASYIDRATGAKTHYLRVSVTVLPVVAPGPTPAPMPVTPSVATVSFTQAGTTTTTSVPFSVVAAGAPFPTERTIVRLTSGTTTRDFEISAQVSQL